MRCPGADVTSDAGVIEPQSNLLYLGSLISDDGRVVAELQKKLGIANGDFRKLSRIWRHSSLGRRRKLQILDALIFSKLLYGLPATWLNASERRKLNGFQNRCLRSVWGIQTAYLSRVSNAKVLQVTGQGQLTKTLEKRQLLLYGRVARQTDSSPMREVTFSPGTLQPAVDRFVRKVGRPRSNWTTEVGKLALKAAGGLRQLQDTLFEPNAWMNVVDTFIS